MGKSRIRVGQEGRSSSHLARMANRSHAIAMGIGKLSLFSMMTQRLAWLGKRQQILAQNVANADTPGYLARDLKELSFRELLGKGGSGGITMTRTQAGHIAPSAGADKTKFKSQADVSNEVSLSGNSVDIEDQMMKVAKTTMDHQVTVNLYRKHIAMMKAALGRPGG